MSHRQKKFAWRVSSIQSFHQGVNNSHHCGTKTVKISSYMVPHPPALKRVRALDPVKSITNMCCLTVPALLPAALNVNAVCRNSHIHIGQFCSGLIGPRLVSITFCGAWNSCVLVNESKRYFVPSETIVDCTFIISVATATNGHLHTYNGMNRILSMCKTYNTRQRNVLRVIPVRKGKMLQK